LIFAALLLAMLAGATRRLAGQDEPYRSHPETELTKLVSLDATRSGAPYLGPAQNLGVAISFPQEYILMAWMGVFGRNPWLFAGPILIFLYYLFAWLRIGPEPPLGSVPVFYEPPVGLSPAAVRYVRTAGCDGRTLAAVLAQLAGRGCVDIILTNGKYKLTQRKVDSSVIDTLAPEESRVLELLFEDGPETFLEPSNPRNLNVYLLGISGQVLKRLGGKYFTWNAGTIAVGLLASLSFAMGMALTATGKDTSGIFFLTWWFFFCGSMTGILAVTSAIPGFLRVLQGLGGARQVIPLVAALGVFGSALVYLFHLFAKNVSPTYAVVLTILVALNVIWMPALKRLTAQGKEAMREIEGFRQFLMKVDQDPMQRLNAGGQTLKDAAGFVPYAIALEVKEAWGDHLAAACFAAPTSK
jgi:Predicted membrane protein (DUF2207) C-terminal domain